MRVGGGDTERLRVSRPHPHPSGLRPATFPPVGGRLGVRSNREEFGPLWDVWIHILGIVAECACLEGGRPSVPPLRRKHGKPGRRALQSGLRATGGWGHPPLRRSLGEKRRAHNVRPYTAFTNGSIYKKRDRSGTCPLKRRGEAELRRKFFCLLFFQEK